MTEASIQDRASFEIIRYANCWEDADVLCAALEPAPGKRLLSIASGGDNTLALLAEGADVVAADLSPAQLAVVELKVAAIRHLGRGGTLEFLGIRDSPLPRAEVFERLAGSLSAGAERYWRERPETLEAGVIHAGKFESYFRILRRKILPLVHGRKTVRAVLEERTPPERERFYRDRWDTWRWRLLFRLFFSRWVMARLGRDPEFFRFVEGSVADEILKRARRALTDLPTHANPYLDYILTGNFRTLPRYLRPEPFAKLEGRLDRLELAQGSIADVASSHADDGFDGFNLSDVFEYLDPELCRSIYETLVEHSRPGARLAYWNMLVPRRRPDSVADRVSSLDEQAAELYARDLAFFYGTFVVEQVSRE
ncbi:MAG: DUF3419 family protein [bacterium]|nr:DUF3419 family protein [bacterium]